MGRLFDAVAALCGVGAGRGNDDPGGAMSYEGQAAIGLEQLATDADPDAASGIAYSWLIEEGSPAVIDGAPLVRDVVDDLRRGHAPAAVAARFHRSVAAVVVDLCVRQREVDGLAVVALSGGVFQNRLLVELVVPKLESQGFTVLRHAQVPPNDGGIPLGQVAIGRAHLANA